MNSVTRPAGLARVLIAAENASTRFGGEAILPFHYFRRLCARGIDAHLITHERTRDELLEHFPDDRHRLHFVPDMALQKLFFRVGAKLPRRVDEATFGLANQMLTQHAQRSILRSLIVPGTVIHQPTPVSPRFPSLLAGLGAPLVAGPLNGGMEYPPGFEKAESLLSRVVVTLARSMTAVANTCFTGKRNAALVLIANERTRRALPHGLRGRVVPLPENGVDTGAWAAASSAAAEPARFVFIGRLVDWKALDVVLDALSRVPTATLEVIGDGPMRGAWTEQARTLGLGSRVDFRGWMTQTECAERLHASGGLVLPSLFESGGAVVLEAMAAGRPVIATAWGGPTDYLDPHSGILVEPTNREALVAGFAEAMRLLVASPELCRRMGDAGRLRVEREFDWERKIDRMLELYAEALTGPRTLTRDEVTR